jgi:uroporphyrinogen decarboxylase
MLSRRRFFLGATVPMMARAAGISAKQRLDAVLSGKTPDRAPYTLWYHFLDEKQPAKVHAANTLSFHRRFRTDLVKVMSDYPYPRPAKGQWWELKEERNPFPEQIESLKLIRDGLKGEAYFIETIFNPFNVAEKLSSKEEVQRLKRDNPGALLNALEVIARSEANHAKLAIAAGAAGIFLAIANAQQGILSPEEYAKFSEPFDRMVVDAVSSAPLNTLHIHGDKVYLDLFLTGWRASVLNYSTKSTGVPLAVARKKFTGVLMGGIDEQNFRTLEPGEMKRQISASEVGPKYIVAPGCSVPNETTDEEILKLTRLIGA